ncbi:MAG: ParB/RepB/Spo0J family partition protein, partial [Alphaproteobacteria bacterium]|nr:ParB/RepB/Spo0J family partition protein [Alphaproteobacteria bacterium]
IDLTESIRQKGILQPILVRPKNNFLEIIAGERRYRAALKAGLQMVPVIKKDLSDAEAFEIALIENMVRQNLNPMEEAAGFDKLIKEYGYTHEDLSKSIRKSRSYITNSLRLLDLPLSVQKMVSNKQITAGHAKVLVGLQNAESLAQKIIDKDLSVRQTEDLIAQIKNRKTPKIHIAKDENLRTIEQKLSESLNTKAEISFNEKGKGKIVLKYNNFNELEQLLNKLKI